MNWAEQWAEAIVQSLRQFGMRIGQFVPQLLGMIFILFIGYLVSKLLQRAAREILARAGFDAAGRRVGVQAMLDRAQITAAPSAIVAKLVFWFFMLTFLISAAEAIGLDSVSGTIDSFVAYLPSVAGAGFVAIVGLFVAGMARDVVRDASRSVGFEYSNTLGQLAFGVITVVTVVLVIGQLRIEATLINRIIEIVLIAVGAALALTLGLGTRDIAKQIVAGVYARDVFRPGVVLAVGSESGALEEVGTVNARIRTSNGDAVFIPNAQLLELVVRSTRPPSGQPEG